MLKQLRQGAFTENFVSLDTVPSIAAWGSTRARRLLPSSTWGQVTEARIVTDIDLFY